jgi:hypothetical protein
VLKVKYPGKALLFILCLSQTLLFSKEEVSVSQENCGLSPPPFRIAARYTIGRGVGYSEGYATLEGFFARSPSLDNSWIPYLDVRGHVFNNGKPALNAGFGVRYLGSRVWGINAYYDYRNTVHQHYNQVSLGLESLGIIWDFRINGYLPVGAKISSPFDVKFNSFQGNKLIVSTKREFAMKGANAEVGAHITRMKNAELYAAVGPFYFQNEGKRSWGGEGRLVFETLKCIRLQVNGSYDSLFKGIIQGEVGLFYAFGPRQPVYKTKVHHEKNFFSSSKSKKIVEKEANETICEDAMQLRDRALQRVDRNEIIVLDKKRQKSTALDPNGQAYTLFFVDNTSHSSGTYESPFNNLTTAESHSKPGDIIYVFPGDGTSQGLDTGITLQDSQKLWGASIPHKITTQFGTITIPPLAGTPPTLNNSSIMSGLSTVNLQNNNEVSGFKIVDVQGTLNASGIALMSGHNALITQNTVISIADANNIIIGDPNGILPSPSGTIIMTNNQILGGDLGDTYGIQVNGCEGLVVMQNNLFSGIDSMTGLAEGVFVNFLLSQVGTFNVSIADNVFSSAMTGSMFSDVAAISVMNGLTTPVNISITGNQITVPQAPSMMDYLGGLIVNMSSSAPMQLNVIDNIANTGSVTSYVLENSSSMGLLQVNFTNNVGSQTGPW